jgi:hypothetical protein
LFSIQAIAAVSTCSTLLRRFGASLAHQSARSEAKKLTGVCHSARAGVCWTDFSLVARIAQEACRGSMVASWRGDDPFRSGYQSVRAGAASKDFAPCALGAPRGTRRGNKTTFCYLFFTPCPALEPDLQVPPDGGFLVGSGRQVPSSGILRLTTQTNPSRIPWPYRGRARAASNPVQKHRGTVVSILARPEGRALQLAVRVVRKDHLFQSSLGPKAQRYRPLDKSNAT